jgi:hypothetical protein
MGFCGGTGPANILAHGDGLQVIRINAARNPAQVVNRQALGDLAPVQFVGNAVCRAFLAVVHNQSVSGTVKPTGPEPAPRFRINRKQVPEANFDWNPIPHYAALRGGFSLSFR